MLGDWYFCHCVKARSDQTSLFLSILEILENSRTEGLLLDLTFDELPRFDAWMQIYAFPHALRGLRRQPLNQTRDSGFSDYFDNLLSQFSAELVQDFAKLKQAMLNPDPVNNIGPLLEKCARRVEKLPSRNESPTPYMDLTAFVPESVLFAILADSLERDPKLIGHDEDSDSALERLLLLACRHRFGRLPFRLAFTCQALISLGSLSHDEVLDEVTRLAQVTAPWEPDIVETVVTALYRKDAGDASGAGLQDIFQECVTLERFHGLLQRTQRREKYQDLASEAIERLGLSADNETGTLLPRLYWHHALWSLAARQAPEEAAQELVRIWRMPDSQPPQRAPVLAAPYPPDRKGDWWHDLEPLRNLRNLNCSIELKVQSHTDISPQAAWILFSPFLNINNRDSALLRFNRDQPRYPKAESPMALLRLLSGASVAAKIVQEAPELGEGWDTQARLLVHTADVLRSFPWLANYSPQSDSEAKEKFRLLPSCLIALAQHVRALVWNIGRARLAGISPRLFIDLLTIENPPTRDGRTLHRRVLSEVLMTWIRDAYVGIFEEGQSGRWLEFLPEVYESFLEEKHSLKDRLDAEILLRFLKPRYPRKGKIDWQVFGGRDMAWPRDGRLLLLSPELPPGAWIRPEWSDAEAHPQILLARAVERLVSLESVKPEERADWLIHEGWLEDLKNELEKIASKQQLNRFVRLRLIDLFDSSALQEAPAGPDILALVARTIVEYGGPFDLKEMLDRMFRQTAGGDLLDRHLLPARRAFVYALYQRLSSREEGEALRVNPESPYLRLEMILRGRQIRDLLHTVASHASADEKVSWFAELLRLHGRPQTPPQTPLNLEVRLDRPIRYISLPKLAQDVDHWTVTGATYDPNHMTTTIFVDQLFRIDDWRNLFGCTVEELNRISRNHTEEALGVLGIVISSWRPKSKGGSAGNSFQLEINCGLRYPVRVKSERGFSKGSLLGVSLTWHPEKGNLRPQVTDKVRFIGRKVITGVPREHDLEPRWLPREGRQTFDIFKRSGKGRSGPPIYAEPFELWCSDTSWFFRKGHLKSYRLFLTESFEESTYEGKPRKTWINEPLDHDLLYLLLQEMSYAGGSTAVLTFLGDVESEHGGTGYRFSTRPGKTCVLQSEDFLPNSWEKLVAKIEEKDDPRGLLVTVAASRHTLVARLLCVEGSPPAGMEEDYPGLDLPFDDRNIQWRSLFRSEQEIHEAYRSEDGEWLIDLASEERVPGFPDRVRVRWKQKPLGNHCFASIYWSERCALAGEARAHYVKQDKLRLTPGQEFKELSWWRNLKKGAAVDLIRLLGFQEKDGTIRAVISFGILVSVYEESLSMFPVDGEQLGDYLPQGKRRARVDYHRWYPLDSRPLIEESDLPAWLLEPQLEMIGVITESTRSQGSGEGRWVVSWFLDGSVRDTLLRVRNHGALRLGPGGLLELTWHGSRPVFRGQSFHIKVDASWQLVDWQAGMEPLRYLGQVFIDGDSRHIAEPEPPGSGTLVVLPSGAVPGRHLDRGNGLRFNERTLPDLSGWRVENQAGAGYPRAVLPIVRHSSQRIVGSCSKDSSRKLSAVAGISLRLLGRGPYYTLRRFFEIREIQKGPRRGPKFELVQDKIREELWQAFLGSEGRIVEGDLDVKKKLLTLTKFCVKTQENRWAGYVPIREGDSPFIDLEKYRHQENICSNVQARLLQAPSGEWQASFRTARPLTIDEYRSDLGVDFGVEKTLEKRLYYVTQFDPRGDAAEPSHLFEWWPGRTLLVPESRLRLDDFEPFGDAKSLLFHGDSVRTLSFAELPRDSLAPPPAADDSGEQKDCILVLNGLKVDFEPAESRQLYLQRLLGIVHVLHLEWVRRQLVIRSVLGYEVGTAREAFHAFGVQAVLSETDLLRLQRRFEAGEVPPNEAGKFTVSIYGRFDENEYVLSYGERIKFRHVRMSFEPQPDGPECLQPHELIFVRAGEIIPVSRNDRALSLVALKRFPALDVGEDMNSLRLLRREFSVRENLLSRIAEDEESYQELRDRILLVRITSHEDMIQALFSKSIPARRRSALHGEIKARQGMLFATVAEVSEGVRLELEPGIFFNLRKENIAKMPADLQEGAVVRMENVERESAGPLQFRLLRAAYSQARYVDEAPRPAVALPKNTLLHHGITEDPKFRQDDYWLNRKQFTIGDLPDIPAAPGWYDNRTASWQRPRAWNVLEILKEEHPKIVRLGRYQPGEYRISSAMWDFPAGSLAWDEETKNLRAELTVPEKRSEDLPWRFATFADESVQDVTARIKLETWSYHDTESGYWTDQGVKRAKLGKHTAKTGPIFFERDNGTVLLRYSTDQLARLGFPAAALWASLRSKRRRRFSYTVVCGTTEGLWIELTPGRVVELCGELLVVKINGEERALTSLEWQRFAPGDRVTLALASRDVITYDRFELLDWRFGARGALADRSFLPTHYWDAEKGRLDLGHGDWRLSLPVSTFDERWKSVALRSNNCLEDGNRYPLRRDDVVLLECGKQGEVFISGFPGLSPIPEVKKREAWEGDPLTHHFGTSGQDLTLTFDKEKFCAFIEAAGGALPVTLEWVDDANGNAYFSRRHQSAFSRLQPGKRTFGRITGGFFSNAGWVAVLRCGAGLVLVPVTDLVFGLPSKFAEQAVSRLAGSVDRIWLRAGSAGDLSAGFADEGSREFSVEVVEKLHLETENAGSGLICRSPDTERMYWMPAEEIGWSDLSYDDLIFIHTLGLLRVTLHNDGGAVSFLSMIETNQAKKAIRDFSLGKELTVQVLTKRETGREGRQSYLVQHLQFGVLLECEQYLSEESPEIQELRTGEDLRVEVIERRIGKRRPNGGHIYPRLRVTPLGQRRFRIDLPGWMTSPDLTAGKLRPEFDEYQKWRRQEPASGDRPLDVGNLSAQELRYHLVQAWNRREAGSKDPKPGTSLAMTWCQQNRYQQEIELHYALISVLLLHGFGRTPPGVLSTVLEKSKEEVGHWAKKWREVATATAQELGRRALRSQHVEILFRRWLGNPELPRHGLWARLPDLQKALQPPVNGADIDRIRQFCRAVDIHGTQELNVVAAALRASLGELRDFGALNPKETLLGELALIYRSLPHHRAGMLLFLQDAHARDLERILRQIDTHAYDITLLAPLPLLQALHE